MRPLSYTQISLYQSCPLSYKLQYIDGLKTKDKWYFSFGSTLHKCAEFFFKVRVPPPPSLNELLQHYEREWLSEGYESAEEEANYKAYGKQLLSEFWQIHNTGFKMPVAVERPFTVDIQGVKLRGLIDRVDKLDSGGLSIVDYKTSRELFTSDHLTTDLQLTLYQLAAEQIWQQPVHRLTLYHFRTNTACTCGARDKTQLDAARQVVLEVAEGIAQGNFPAIENDFCPCDFPEYCPYHKQKYISQVAESKETDVLCGMAPAEAVEQYVLLQSQMKQLELQFDELKQRVIAYCQAGELNRVYGKEHAITYKLVGKAGFLEDEVKALLEPAGLWQKVLSFDPSLAKSLLEDESLEKALREKLAALNQVISSYPRLTVRRLIEE